MIPCVCFNVHLLSYLRFRTSFFLHTGDCKMDTFFKFSTILIFAQCVSLCARGILNHDRHFPLSAPMLHFSAIVQWLLATVVTLLEVMERFFTASPADSNVVEV